MLFQQIDPKITTGNFGARIPEFLTPVKAFRPFFIHPSRKNVHLNKAEREALSKRPIRFQGIIMEWLRENAVCMLALCSVGSEPWRHRAAGSAPGHDITPSQYCHHRACRSWEDYFIRFYKKY